MAQYQHLPIYRLTYELLQQVVKFTKEFPRDLKFTVGQQLNHEVIELVVLIYRANSANNKSETIGILLERLQVVELLIRLSRDMRILPTKAYASLVEMTESIGKQAQGWKRAMDGKKRA